MLQRYYTKQSKEDVAASATAKYPYTYARVSAMKAALLKKSSYDKLLKMSLSEATSFLESTEYKKEIDELAVNYKGVELIELAINKNLSNTYIKLRRISNPSLRVLLDTYLRRKDIANIKTVLRGKYTSSGEKEITAMLQPYELSQEFLKSLLKKQDIAEILKEIKSISPAIWKQAHEKFMETNMLVEIENALDQHYFKQVTDISSKLPTRGTLFKKFLQEEIEIINMLNIIRFKRERMDKKDIQRYVFTSGKGPDTRLKRLINAGNEETAAALESTAYGTIAKRGITEYKEKGTLIYLETDLYRHLLKKALMLVRQMPLVADAILGYLFAKEIEARNLKLIVKAKQLGLAQEFIEDHIIT